LMRLRSCLNCAAFLAASPLIAGCASKPQAPRHTPQTRNVTVTAVPLLTKEMTGVYPFLATDFRKGGVLDGKEVYAFIPDNITVFEGDTVHFTLINPEDDAHSFVLATLRVSMPPQSTASATYVARQPGVFDYICEIPSHKPMMYGQLVVLPAR
jgi:plastocyanin